jgi:hypothetical protein
LSAVPPIGPPLYDASVRSDHHFAMSLEFPDVFEAFARFHYVWSRRRVSDDELWKVKGFDPFKGGTRPGWGEVGRLRASRAGAYANEDVKRAIDNLGVVWGQPGGELGLVTAGALLRYVGLGFGFAVERALSPRSEQAVAFPEGEGLYVVACAATPILQGEGFVRAPSVAWMPIFVRSPEAMAERRVDALVKQQEDAQSRLKEITQLLSAPTTRLDRDELIAEARRIERSMSGLHSTLSLQIDELRDRLDQLHDDSSASAAAERELVESRLERLQQTAGVQAERQGRHGAAVEPLTAVFVSDKGVVRTLALEASRTAFTTAGGRTTSETWYVSDLTTPDSDDAARRGATKGEALEAAIRTILEGVHGYGAGHVTVALPGGLKTLRIARSEGAMVLEAVENLSLALSVAAVAAAPFTAGASLALLLPVGVVGAVPSAYRIASRAENGTLRWDMSLASDIVNVVAGIGGLGEVASGLGMLRLARGLLIVGVGANGLGVLVMGVETVHQIDSLSDLPPGLKAGRTFEIVGSALLQAGIMIGAAMVAKGRAEGTRESLQHSEGAKGKANLEQAAANWEQRLSLETQNELARDPTLREAYRTMDPEVRRALTLCESPCIPNPPPGPAELAKIRSFMDRLGLPPDHPGLREYLHDMKARNEMTAAATALDSAKTRADAQRIFDQAIARWGTDRVGTATKNADRWQVERANDRVVVQEWEVDTYARLAADRATNSFFQAHHGIQDKWAVRVPGYAQGDCPAILLRDSFAGSPHRRVTDRQGRHAGDRPTRTYADERALMIADTVVAEVRPMDAQRLVVESDAYFGKLYRAWEADMRQKGRSQAFIDQQLTSVFGTWVPKP